jgi:hypothetical protein
MLIRFLNFEIPNGQPGCQQRIEYFVRRRFWAVTVAAGILGRPALRCPGTISFHGLIRDFSAPGGRAP